MPENKLYLEITKSLVLTCNKVALYAPNHPIVKQSLTQVNQLFKKILTQSFKATLSLRGETIFWNDISLPANAMGAGELVEKLKGLQIDSITFSSGLEDSELASLIGLLSSGKKIEAKEQRTKDELLAGKFAHIQANIIHYEKVEDGQKIVSSAIKEAEEFIERAQESGEAKEKKSPLEIFSDYLCGKDELRFSDQDKKGIIEQLLKDPISLTNAIMQAAISCASFEAVFKKLKDSIIEDLASELIEKRRKPDRVILSLRRVIDASLDDTEISKQVKINKPAAEELINQFANELRTSILKIIFETAKQNTEKFLSRAVNFLSSPQECAEIAPALKTFLLNKGLKEPDCEMLLAKLQSGFQDKEKVTISKLEYEQLRSKGELFEKDLVDRVNEATQDLKKKNKRLADEKERVDTVIRNLADGLIVVDNQGKLVMINPAAEQLLGIDKSNKLGQSLAENLSSHQLVAMTKGALGDEEGAFSKEIELKSTDEQTKKILRASSAVVENENGNTVGMVMMLSDVTRQKQVEKMKNDFVAKMSHELRTPLIAAQKSISLILSKTAGQVNEDQDKFLGIANSNLGRLSRLIDAILDVAKIEAGKIRLTQSTFNIADLIKESCRALSSWATDKHINLVTEATPEKIDLVADRDKINQVLINLIGNAFKFTPRDGEVRVSCKEVDPDSVQVSVKDNGIGIGLQDCKRIFNKFEQVSLVSPPGIGGTGLGLYISKEIIDMHSGKIWVESEIEKGSAFNFVIPKKFTPEENSNKEKAS